MSFLARIFHSNTPSASRHTIEKLIGCWVEKQIIIDGKTKSSLYHKTYINSDQTETACSYRKLLEFSENLQLRMGALQYKSSFGIGQPEKVINQFGFGVSFELEMMANSFCFEHQGLHKIYRFHFEGEELICHHEDGSVGIYQKIDQSPLEELEKKRQRLQEQYPINPLMLGTWLSQDSIHNQRAILHLKKSSILYSESYYLCSDSYGSPKLFHEDLSEIQERPIFLYSKAFCYEQIGSPDFHHLEIQNKKLILKAEGLDSVRLFERADIQLEY